MRLSHPKAGRIEQGAIFNCAVVPGYDKCECWGIIMTARCDIEHNKYSVINYLPVVRFSDWLQRGFSQILAKRIRNELEKDLTSQLNKKGVSPKIREIFPLEDVIRQETKVSEQKALLEKCSQLRTVSTLLASVGAPCAERV